LVGLYVNMWQGVEDGVLVIYLDQPIVMLSMRYPILSIEGLNRGQVNNAVN
jgi:hypothetical protein